MFGDERGHGPHESAAISGFAHALPLGRSGGQQPAAGIVKDLGLALGEPDIKVVLGADGDGADRQIAHAY
jgi:hypothetical protein